MDIFHKFVDKIIFVDPFVDCQFEHRIRGCSTVHGYFCGNLIFCGFLVEKEAIYMEKNKKIKIMFFD